MMEVVSSESPANKKKMLCSSSDKDARVSSVSQLLCNDCCHYLKLQQTQNNGLDDITVQEIIINILKCPTRWRWVDQ